MVYDLLDLFDSMAELLFVCRVIYNLSMHLCLSLLYDVVELWFSNAYVAEFVIWCGWVMVYQCICGWVCFTFCLSYGLTLHLWPRLCYDVAEFVLSFGW